MHRLVQLSTRKWLGLNQKLEKWRKESLRRVAVAFPSGEYEAWAACQVLLPLSRTVLSYLLDNEDKNEVVNRATIAFNIASYLNPVGDYPAAEMVGRVGVEGRRKVPGQEHSDTLDSIKNLGLVLDKLGKYEEAEEMHRQVLEGKKKMLGEEHLDTLISVNDLALVLKIRASMKRQKRCSSKC